MKLIPVVAFPLASLVYPFEGKGLIVAMSRRIAVDLYNEIIKLKPEWHNNDLSKGAINVVMTAVSADGPVMLINQ